MSVAAGANDVALATRDKLRGGIGKTKVRRYWPGKAPLWSTESEDQGHEEEEDVRMQNMVVHHVLGVATKDDPRLRRLAQTRIENREEARAEHLRVRHAAEIISTQEEEEEDQVLRSQDGRVEVECDEDAIEEERRRRIREKNLKRAQEEAALLPAEEEEEEEESEYETDSEYEIIGITMIKPAFVRKAKRDTIIEREGTEAKEEALLKLAKRKLELRKIETKQIVVEEVRKDEEIRKNMIQEEETHIGDVETDDEINEAEEYQVWMTRETARLKRKREAMLREVEEMSNKTTEQERTNPRPSSSASQKKKRKFMQRYYHKGAFFQEDSILQRDFSDPTGEDRLDKWKQRKVQQVKNFGRSGRTKWTHLVKEDTTYAANKDKENTTKAKRYSEIYIY